MHEFSFQILAGKILHNICHDCHVYHRRLEKHIIFVHHEIHAMLLVELVFFFFFFLGGGGGFLQHI